MRLLITFAAGLLLLGQIFCALALFFRRDDATCPKTIRAATILTVLSPVLVCILLIIGVHLRRIAPFQPLDLAAMYKQEVLATVPTCDALCQLGTKRFFAGIALMGLAFAGVLSMVAVWRRSRRVGFAGLGASLLSGIVGVSIYTQEVALRTINRAWDMRPGEIERFLVDSLPTFKTPPVFILAAGACVVLLCVLFLVLLRTRLKRIVVERSALVAGLVVLVIGAVAFVFTRSHARDIDKTLTELMGRTDDSGRHSVPKRITSAVFGEIQQMQHHDPNFKLDDDISLPESTAAIEPKWAISVSITPEELKVEGNTIAKIKDGKLAGDVVDFKKRRIKPLYSLLKKFKEIMSQQEEKFLGEESVISLQVDQNLPFVVVDRVMRTASQAGFPLFRLVVLKRHQEPLSGQQISIVHTSAPWCCLERDSPEVRSYLESGDPGDDSDIALLLKKGDSSTTSDRFAKVRLEDVVMEQEIPLDQLPEPAPEKADGPARIILEVRIGREGFSLSAIEVRTRKELAGLRARIPKTSGEYDFATLAGRIKEIHDKHIKSDTVIIRSAEQVLYDTVIKALDASREWILNERLDTRVHLFTWACLILSEEGNSGSGDD